MNPNETNQPTDLSTNPKPPMSQTEASWHETQAGNRAKLEAEQQGGDMDALQAIADATSPNKFVAGYELKPASQGTIFALQAVAAKFESYAKQEEIHTSGDVNNPGLLELLEISLSVLVFADSKRCYNLARNGKIDELRYEAEEIIWEMPLAVAMELTEHFSSEMDRVKQLNGEVSPGKQQTIPSGDLPAKSPQQVETPSPSPNG